jgi:hypothetical protein
MTRWRFAVLVLAFLGAAAVGGEPGHAPGKFHRPNTGYPACSSVWFPACYRLRAWFHNNRDYIYPPCYPERYPGCKSMKERDREPPPPPAETPDPDQARDSSRKEPEKEKDKYDPKTP